MGRERRDREKILRAFREKAWRRHIGEHQEHRIIGRLRESERKDLGEHHLREKGRNEEKEREINNSPSRA